MKKYRVLNGTDLVVVFQQLQGSVDVVDVMYSHAASLWPLWLSWKQKQAAVTTTRESD